MNDALKARFDKEVGEHPIVIYMKGSQLFPQCGFSARALAALKPLGKIHSVDVLADAEVRDGIKQYSNWPTIPQVFIKGNFVDGCDIVTDLASRGELEALLNG